MPDSLERSVQIYQCAMKHMITAQNARVRLTPVFLCRANAVRAGRTCSCQGTVSWDSVGVRESLVP